MPGKAKGIRLIPMSKEVTDKWIKVLKELGATEISKEQTKKILATIDDVKYLVTYYYIRPINEDKFLSYRDEEGNPVIDKNLIKEFIKKPKQLYKIKDNKIVVRAAALTFRKFKFKDGSIITASSVEEAKAKHKVMAENILPDELKEIQEILENNGFKNIKIAKSKTVKLSDFIKREQEENPHRRYKEIDKDEILYKGGVLYLENALKKIKDGTIFADSSSNRPEEITFRVNIVKENKQQNGIVHQTIENIITVPATAKGVKDALKYLKLYK